MGHPRLRPSGPVSRRTAAEERYPSWQITIFDLEPPKIDRSLRTPEAETVLGRHRDQLVYPLAVESIISD